MGVVGMQLCGERMHGVHCCAQTMQWAELAKEPCHEEVTHHGQRHNGSDVPLDDRQLCHHLLQVRRRIPSPIVNVPHDASCH